MATEGRKILWANLKYDSDGYLRFSTIGPSVACLPMLSNVSVFEDILVWMGQNRLKLNFSKMELLFDHHGFLLFLEEAVFSWRMAITWESSWPGEPWGVPIVILSEGEGSFSNDVCP